MSNASFKEQMQAVASQFSDTNESKVKNKPHKRPAPTSAPVQNQAKPKARWLEYAQYGVELLRAYFPACFKSGNEIKPLKKGIKQDLVKRLSEIATIVTEDKACMVKSLAFYVNTAAYHRSVVKGAERIDIDGNPSGVVTEEEATYSVERHQAKLQAKMQTKHTAHAKGKVVAVKSDQL